MIKQSRWLVLATVAGLSACAVVPTGPSITALPGSNKTFDQFRYDDASCRQFASAQVGGQGTNDAVTSSAVGTAALGTAIGAAAGAAFGGGHGAAVGAGAGLLAGGLVGSSNTQASAYNIQQRYDGAYVQCMYAAGERVPVSGDFITAPGNGGGTMQAPGPTPMPPPGVQPPPPM